MPRRFRSALRHAFTILSALSLLLCVAVCVLWVRSHFRMDEIRWARSRQYAVGAEWKADVRVDMLASGCGVVQGFWGRESLMGDREAVVYLANDNFSLDRPFQWRHPPASAPQLVADNASWLRRQGFRFERTRTRPEWPTGSEFWPRYPPNPLGVAHHVRLSVPHWFLVLLTSAIPAVRITRALRRRRAGRDGLCPHCGYDLRASPERCPECGTPVQSAA